MNNCRGARRQELQSDGVFGGERAESKNVSDDQASKILVSVDPFGSDPITNLSEVKPVTIGSSLTIFQRIMIVDFRKDPSEACPPPELSFARPWNWNVHVVIEMKCWQ
jgi:hypothetical protein